MGAAAPCERRHWVPRWDSSWGHERVMGVPQWARQRHAGATTGAVGGAPYWATKRLRGVPAWAGAVTPCDNNQWIPRR
eukprot:2461732-Pyramimonas_sp.AAC.1